jgi:hypothetical protein
MNTEDRSFKEEQECIVCERDLGYRGAFAYLKHCDEMVSLCCPLCFEAFRRNPSVYVLRRDERKAVHFQKN